jgi:DNA repair protein RadD
VNATATANPTRLTLRPYQEGAIQAILAALNGGHHPVASLPTGSGKAIVAAELCNRLDDGRVLVVTHRKELIDQNEKELLGLGGADTGVYSAGLDRRETDARTLFAGVQSIYTRMDELQKSGKFKYIIVDEVHLVSSTLANPTSMYRTVFDACPDAQRIGLTATPYRLDDGPIWGEDGSWFDLLAVDIPMVDLIRQGYLAPLVGVSTAASVDLSNVRKRGADYALSDLSQASSEEGVVNAALDEICYLARDRHSWLLFCVDVAHTRIVTEALRDRGIDAEMIVGDSRITPGDSRDELIESFKARKLRALVNCNVLTTGSNLPCVDMVALLRATLSKSLCIQMIGRGSRLYPGKSDALILDTGNNLERHMPIDGIPQAMKSPAKAEADKRERQARQQRERKPRHDAMVATGIDPLSSKPVDGEEVTLQVESVAYAVRSARKYPSRENLLVFYTCRTPSGGTRQVTQFVLVEYPGRPSNDARAWFDRRGADMPARARQAMAKAWKLPKPDEIVVVRDGKWDRIVMEHFSDG